ncbi:hypothetical protein [Pseudomonas asiatica]|uniref:hypothetical protein n=1 Tax=Pseudomonas asiatica TaxID=2219225 RepID=UPI0016646694|nr:hypothetical protein [Pseudomonas asiatica]QNT38680.1 hypothetical protein ICJ54_13935 [Pseudomonas asiatica]
MATKKTPDAATTAPATVTYRDKTYTSRVLIMGKRELKVAGGQLQIEEGDTEALTYLDARADFECLTPAG